MAGSTRLIIGLGNPGAQYEGTRHNIGFAVVDHLAMDLDVSFETQGLISMCRARYRSRPLILAKPQTFMNRSGSAVKRLLGVHQLDLQEMLIIVDDINLDLGAVRLRQSGGGGGHNGMEDIIDGLDSANFPRMRIGVGSSFPRGRQADYVLSPFEPDELPAVEEVVETACDAALAFVTSGIVTAMNRFNRRSTESRDEQ